MAQMKVEFSTTTEGMTLLAAFIAELIRQQIVGVITQHNDRVEVSFTGGY
jgi:hypothetical protein